MSNIAFQKIYNVIPSLWSSDSNKVGNLANNEILNIGNALSGIFLENQTVNLETPQLVVIGNQSSGKSSVLKYDPNQVNWYHEPLSKDWFEEIAVVLASNQSGSS